MPAARAGIFRLASALVFAAAACAPERDFDPDISPGAPGAAPTWATGAKTGVGTSYEAYLFNAHDDDAPTGPVSKVWFTLADGGVTEVSHGLIHERQLKSVRFAVAGDGFTHFDDVDMDHTQSFMFTDKTARPLAPAYEIVSRGAGGRYTLTKSILTDPDRQALLIKVKLEGDRGLRLHALVDPNLANTAAGDMAETVDGALYASEGDDHVAVFSSTPFEQTSVGFAGVSDGRSDLRVNGVMDWAFKRSGDQTGDVSLTAKLPDKSRRDLDFVLAVGFGPDTRGRRGGSPRRAGGGVRRRR